MCPERSVTHVSGMDNAENGAPERNRTSDLPLRRRPLYPLSYEGVLYWQDTRNKRDIHHIMAGQVIPSVVHYSMQRRIHSFLFRAMFGGTGGCVGHW